MFFNIFIKIKVKGGRSAFEKWRHRRAHASRRELQASTSRGGCHLLRRCRVHRPSRFAPAPATDPARYRSTPRLVFPRRVRAATFRIATRAQCGDYARRERSAFLRSRARDRATVSFTSCRRRSLQKIMVSATQRLDSARDSCGPADSAAIRFNRDVPRCYEFKIVRHVTRWCDMNKLDLEFESVRHT